MQEIKFRGQQKTTKKWISGFPVWNGDRTKCYILNSLEDILRLSFPVSGQEKTIFDCEVIPETVGQFTGLHDKDGKEIYGGDILEYEKFICYNKKDGIKTKTLRCAVVWHKCGFCTDNLEILTIEFKNCRIVGNVHDNPELLEGTNNE